MPDAIADKTGKTVISAQKVIDGSHSGFYSDDKELFNYINVDPNVRLFKLSPSCSGVDAELLDHSESEKTKLIDSKLNYLKEALQSGEGDLISIESTIDCLESLNEIQFV